jgi:hypothetical protein
MIRFINCIRRRPDITPEEFRHYWNDAKFNDLIGRVIDYTGAAGHSKNLTLIISANDLIREWRRSAEPYDGVLEYWWDHAGLLHNRINTPQCELLLKAMLDYQRQFVDLAQSSAFFTEAHD